MKDPLHKWRLILGANENDGIHIPLGELEISLDNTLNALYDSDRKGGLGSSSPNVSRWLGDIRTYFPSSVVMIMQKDAIEKLNLHQILLEKEMLESVVPDIHLVTTLMTLSKVIPEKTKSTARMIIKKLVDQLMSKLTAPTLQAITGAINKAGRSRNPKNNEIDWKATIRQNLKHYQPSLGTIIPEVMIGYGHKKRSFKDVILCIDQSGSMGNSVVYSSIFGAVMASMPSLNTSLIAFDTEIADLSDQLQDPVDLLFGVQLGGGTDIHKALSYCIQKKVTRPADTILILVSDLYEGGDNQEMLKAAASLVAAGVQLVVILALDDEGAPYYDHGNAEKLAQLGIPAFACTPDKFPDLMGAIINKQDIKIWAAENQ